ncbi:hypothetical protein CXZ10_19835 [Pleomorphomonas diazotrophica]|uniref:RNA 2'-phosphotransferase n=1 Tax=Pleomorphomonas diazotrophica TaxID=1166257 RepID=A0A2N3LS95_9HYPH|nr:hypothetical protein CXZ10_19835 [Pleomorphomonas diazotrophica]
MNELSKVVPHALRHEPWLYELELDDEGWVATRGLLSALRPPRGGMADLGEADLSEMIAQSEKKRHEIAGGRIRALYGHSLPEKLLKQPAEPPGTLYHGGRQSMPSGRTDCGKPVPTSPHPRSPAAALACRSRCGRPPCRLRPTWPA